MRGKLLLLNAVFFLDPHSSSMQFHAAGALHAFDAKVPGIKGETNVGSDLASAHGKLTMEVRTIDTNISLRNTEMLKLLEPDKYPEITFELKSAAPLPNLTEDGRVIDELPPGETRCVLRGNLTVRGRPAPIEGKGLCRNRDANGWEVEGEAPVDMTAFGIAPPKLVFFTMDRLVTAKYKLVFRPR